METNTKNYYISSREVNPDDSIVLSFETTNKQLSFEIGLIDKDNKRTHFLLGIENNKIDGEIVKEVINDTFLNQKIIIEQDESSSSEKPPNIQDDGYDVYQYNGNIDGIPPIIFKNKTDDKWYSYDSSNKFSEITLSSDATHIIIDSSDVEKIINIDGYDVYEYNGDDETQSIIFKNKTDKNWYSYDSSNGFVKITATIEDSAVKQITINGYVTFDGDLEKLSDGSVIYFLNNNSTNQNLIKSELGTYEKGDENAHDITPFVLEFENEDFENEYPLLLEADNDRLSFILLGHEVKRTYQETPTTIYTINYIKKSVVEQITIDGYDVYEYNGDDETQSIIFKNKTDNKWYSYDSSNGFVEIAVNSNVTPIDITGYEVYTYNGNIDGIPSIIFKNKTDDKWYSYDSSSKGFIEITLYSDVEKIDIDGYDVYYNGDDETQSIIFKNETEGKWYSYHSSSNNFSEITLSSDAEQINIDGYDVYEYNGNIDGIPSIIFMKNDTWYSYDSSEGFIKITNFEYQSLMDYFTNDSHKIRIDCYDVYEYNGGDETIPSIIFKNKTDNKWYSYDSSNGFVEITDTIEDSAVTIQDNYNVYEYNGGDETIPSIIFKNKTDNKWYSYDSSNGFVEITNSHKIRIVISNNGRIISYSIFDKDSKKWMILNTLRLNIESIKNKNCKVLFNVIEKDITNITSNF